MEAWGDNVDCSGADLGDLCKGQGESEACSLLYHQDFIEAVDEYLRQFHSITKVPLTYVLKKMKIPP